jgi:hypothetical protein
MKSDYTMGNRNGDLPAYYVTLQLATLTRWNRLIEIQRAISEIDYRETDLQIWFYLVHFLRMMPLLCSLYYNAV